MTLIGVSNNNLAQLENRLGCLCPVVREYRALDRITSYAPLGGRLVIGSAKPKIGQSLVPIGSLLDGTHNDYFTQNAVDLAALPAAPYGRKHMCVSWHEFDVGALNGTPDQINQVILACNKLARNAAAGKLDIATCIGSYNQSLYKAFAPAILDADIVLIDQPYNQSNSASAPTAASILGPRVMALRAMGVKRIGIAEWGSIGFLGRPQWITAATGWMQDNNIEVATYFDNGGDAIVGKGDEYALDSAIYEGRMIEAERLLAGTSAALTDLAFRTRL